MNAKQIILEPNKPPRFLGSWRVGEILQMAQGLIAWIHGLPVETDKNTEKDAA